MAPETTPETTNAPLLKDILDATRIRRIATELAAIAPEIDAARFVAACLDGIDTLSIMERVTRIAEGLHAVLPGDYHQSLAILDRLAPRLDHGFAAMALSAFVALYGRDDVEASLAALAQYTHFGSSEFAIRVFLRDDLERTLSVMTTWSRDADEHVRRLASEGSRPRLPWSFRLDRLVKDPSPLAPILDTLKDDPSLYVRRSVANSLNDITKDNPDWVLDLLAGWPLDRAGPKWIARHALRGLIKKGNLRALQLIGADTSADVAVEDLRVTPAARIGDTIDLAFTLHSTSAQAQRLVVDYAIHYIKKSGTASPKVFKLKTIDLPAGAVQSFAWRQPLTDFTTRTHHPGTHIVEILVSGIVVAKAAFQLER